MYTKVLFNGDEGKAKEYQEGLAGNPKMTNNLFFTCGFKREKGWIVASNRERVSSVDKDKMISILIILN